MLEGLLDTEQDVVPCFPFTLSYTIFNLLMYLNPMNGRPGQIIDFSVNFAFKNDDHT